MISFRIIAVLLVLLLPLCKGLRRDDVSFVRYFVKDWKGYDSVNVFSCPGQVIPSDLYLLNNQMILFRYVDMSRPINLKQMDKDSNCRQVYVVDLKCPQAVAFIRELSAHKIFTTFCRSVLLLDTNEDDEWFQEVLEPVFHEIELTVTSDVIYATRIAINGTVPEDLMDEDVRPDFFLYDIWNPGRYHGGTLKYNLLGQYKSSDEKEESESVNSLSVPGRLQSNFMVLDKRAPIIRRSNLSEITLQCAIVVISHFDDTLENYLTHHYLPYLDTTHRLHFSVVHVVKDMFNFGLFIRRTNSWGYLGINSSDFDGMIGMLQRKEIDIGCSPAFYRVERMIAVDYGEHTWGARPMIIFRHPSGSGKNVFRVPFDDVVWVIMACVSGTLIVGFALILKQEYMAKVNHHHEDPVHLVTDSKFKVFVRKYYHKLTHFIHDLLFLFDSMIMNIGLICQQGSEFAGTERYTGTRCGITFLYIYSFLMLQFYSASIVGGLLMAPPKNIKTIPDLVASPLAVGMQNIVYNFDFFRHTEDADALELYDKKIRILDKKTGNYTLNFFDIDEGLEKMKCERFAFHVDRDSVFKRIVDEFDEKDICDLQMIRLLPKQMMGTVTARGSPFRKVLNYGIHRAAETGILSRERSSWITKKPGCLRNIHAEDLQVQMAVVFPLHKVFVLGVLLSLLVLVGEIIFNLITKRK